MSSRLQRLPTEILSLIGEGLFARDFANFVQSLDLLGIGGRLEYKGIYVQGEWFDVLSTDLKKQIHWRNVRFEARFLKDQTPPWLDLSGLREVVASCNDDHSYETETDMKAVGSRLSKVNELTLRLWGCEGLPTCPLLALRLPRLLRLRIDSAVGRAAPILKFIAEHPLLETVDLKNATQNEAIDLLKEEPIRRLRALNVRTISGDPQATVDAWLACQKKAGPKILRVSSGGTHPKCYHFRHGLRCSVERPGGFEGPSSLNVERFISDPLTMLPLRPSPSAAYEAFTYVIAGPPMESAATRDAFLGLFPNDHALCLLGGEEADSEALLRRYDDRRVSFVSADGKVLSRGFDPPEDLLSVAQALLDLCCVLEVPGALALLDRNRKPPVGTRLKSGRITRRRRWLGGSGPEGYLMIDPEAVRQDPKGFQEDIKFTQQYANGEHAIPFWDDSD